MKRKKKCSFINLAEQLTLQNDIVHSTMDSMLKFVSEDSEVEKRSDFTEIQKTAEQICEMNPLIDSRPTDEIKPNTRLPRPKMSLGKSTSTNKVEG